MEGHTSLELTLTEAELKMLISAVRGTSGGRFPELEFKLPQPGEGHSRNLTNLRPSLMLAETNCAAKMAQACRCGVIHCLSLSIQLQRDVLHCALRNLAQLLTGLLL